MAMPTEKLFKFVSLRPPETVTEAALSENFIQIPPSFTGGPFAKGALASKDAPGRKKVASDFLAAKPANTDVFAASGLTPLQKLRTSFRSGKIAPGTKIADLESGIGTSLASLVKLPEFKQAREDQFQTFAAACVVPSQLPARREQSLAILRTLHLAESLVRDPTILDDAKRLKRVTRARVVLPSQLFAKGAEKPKTATVPGTTTSGIGSSAFNAENLQQLQSLYAAKRELRSARSEHALSLTKKIETPAATRARTSAASTASGVRSVAASVERPNQQLFSTSIKEKFSAGTKKVLQQQGLSLDQLRSDEALASVGGAIRSLRSSVFAGQPASTVTAVSRELTAGKGGLTQWTVAPSITTEPVDETPRSGVGTVKPLGIGDLLIVEQTLQAYEAGEISFVENVLKTESMSRKYRRLDRSEESVFTSTSTTEETEQDLQKTDRYELSTQSQKTIEEDMSAQAGMTVSASYGPVSVGAYGDFSASSSSSDSASTSSTFAQDITERSSTKITTEIREEQTKTVLKEIEETTKHGFDNTNGTGHVTGIYQWLDKRYVAQIYNYGQRLMFEFLIPEPAAFYRYALSNQPMSGVTLSEPSSLSDLRPDDLDEDNYLDYVRLYSVAGVSPPPAECTIIGTSFDQSGLEANTVVTKTSTSLQVPSGYRAKYGRIDTRFDYIGDNYLKVIIGTHQFDGLDDQGRNVELDNEDSVVPVSVIGYLIGFIVNVEVECERTDEACKAWQQETFDAIVTAYNAAVAAYEAQVTSAGYSLGSSSYGSSADENRRVEKEELKKGCLTLLARQYFEDFDAMHHSGTNSGYPEFSTGIAMAEGSYAQFFEQAFEWDQITYLFYPYFWMNKEKWLDRVNLSSTDATFAEFLRAGFARAVVPVRPAYDDAILYFLSSEGELWNGGDAPTIDDDLYVSIAEELDDDSDEAVAVGDPWEITIPTTLVYLKSDSTLPTWTDDDTDHTVDDTTDAV